MLNKGKYIKSDHNKYKEQVNKEFYEGLKKKEKDRKKERITYLELISESLMLPPDIIAGAPIVTIQGRNALCVENHKRILEYSSEKIRILTKICIVCVEGKNLVISYYSKDELKITGYIRCIDYQQGS